MLRSVVDKKMASPRERVDWTRSFQAALAQHAKGCRCHSGRDSADKKQWMLHHNEEDHVHDKTPECRSSSGQSPDTLLTAFLVVGFAEHHLRRHIEKAARLACKQVRQHTESTVRKIRDAMQVRQRRCTTQKAADETQTYVVKLQRRFGALLTAAWQPLEIRVQFRQ